MNGPEEASGIIDLDSDPAGREEVSRVRFKGKLDDVCGWTSNHVEGAWEIRVLRIPNMMRKGKNIVSGSVRAKS